MSTYTIANSDTPEPPTSPEEPGKHPPEIEPPGRQDLPPTKAPPEAPPRTPKPEPAGDPPNSQPPMEVPPTEPSIQPGVPGIIA